MSDLQPTPEDIRWITELRNSQLLGVGGKPLPDLNKRKLLALGWIDEKLGGLVITTKGQDALARHG